MKEFTIEFRAWDKDYKVMSKNVFLYDGETLAFNWPQHRPEEVRRAPGVTLEDDNVLLRGRQELMQYTGLLDKNGSKIFEGDILTCTIRGKKRILQSEVRRHKSGAWVVGEGGDLWHMNELCEVLGNIYENPDLLK